LGLGHASDILLAADQGDAGHPACHRPDHRTRRARAEGDCRAASMAFHGGWDPAAGAPRRIGRDEP
jgi:hypothetical protein